MNNELDRETILTMLKTDFLFHQSKYVDEKKFTVSEIKMIGSIINSFEMGIEIVSLYNEKIAEYFKNFGCIVTKGNFNTDIQCHILKIKIG